MGNEQADRTAKSAVAPMDMTIPAVDLKKHVKMLLYSKWQEQRDLETNNCCETLCATLALINKQESGRTSNSFAYRSYQIYSSSLVIR
ncbi:hypothetical protein AVEN_117112-1 [Araneus ventricosus]|uniref:RNase H type-1 domain-containing protein n=1 Tax=Araneus ventricosus TaxID=182803 RepID=A0A4Y2LNP9_ARAVE|nr:hypothetical protein AVEN_117112-1 [Araneus ventricosus]